MKTKSILVLLSFLAVVVSISFTYNETTPADTYLLHYEERLNNFRRLQIQLLERIQKSNFNSDEDRLAITDQIAVVRNSLKGVDFWTRYLEPLSHKKINGPLPVEWETEVFEKFEKPYKREGAGLTLAALYLEEENPEKEFLADLIQQSIQATQVFSADSITADLKNHHHFYLCNRLYLLNLASIYTTGFECPDTTRVIPELRGMLKSVKNIYTTFNQSFPNTRLADHYLGLYDEAMNFANTQSENYSAFDHFTFLKEYVNPLFALNQKLLIQYAVSSKSLVDYSLNKKATSIFDKSLYHGQNPKGIFIRVKDEEALQEIDKVGKLLFYDPIMSGNNERSCASCHNPKQYFTDTIQATSSQFDHQGFLARNSPSLINVKFNHLLMLDGKHISMQHQTKAVVNNPLELGTSEKEVLEKVLSCKTYKAVFTKLLKYTPQEKEVTFDHIASAITFYYNKFSEYDAPFDDAMNNRVSLDKSVREGFNLFMSKAQCATCHFAPQFNGVKPPFVSSEFEVLGVPEKTTLNELSDDKGRYEINPAQETLNAFRTGSLRNAANTKPYMHNGVFTTLNEVIDFYNDGGGNGRGLHVENQTLSSDSLHLTSTEKAKLIKFIQSLTEDIQFENPPDNLPVSKRKSLNVRKVGGSY